MVNQSPRDGTITEGKFDFAWSLDRSRFISSPTPHCWERSLWDSEAHVVLFVHLMLLISIVIGGGVGSASSCLSIHPSRVRAS